MCVKFMNPSPEQMFLRNLIARQWLYSAYVSDGKCILIYLLKNW